MPITLRSVCCHWGLLLAVCAVACRSAAPDRVALGVREYGTRQYLGSLPWWEGPQTSPGNAPAQMSAQSLAISSDREMKGMIAEIWRDGDQVRYGATVVSGSVVAQAADGRGNVVFFRRHLTPKGDRYDLENDRLYAVDLRRPSPARVLAVPPWNLLRGGTSTVVCAVGGGFVAWTDTPQGVAARSISETGSPTQVAPATPRTAPRDSAPWLCASDDRCASTMFERGANPAVVETQCGDHTEEQALESHWPSSTVLHPSGTFASFDTSHRQSSVTVRLSGRTQQSFDLKGTAYALTFWDHRTLLVHVADGATDSPTHIYVAVLDAEKGPLARLDLDFARTARDRASHPDIVLLPPKGNGRPLVSRLADDLVLITGTGEIWTWRGGR